MVAATKMMKIGDPLDVSTAHGPQNHKRHLDSLLKFIERGESEGAKLVLGGRRVNRKGCVVLEPVLALTERERERERE